MKGNDQYKFRTVVSEVLSFIVNPVNNFKHLYFLKLCLQVLSFKIDTEIRTFI